MSTFWKALPDSQTSRPSSPRFPAPVTTTSQALNDERSESLATYLKAAARANS